MATANQAQKASLDLQVRVSRRVSPFLFDRITSGIKEGESAGSIMRQLAEEALILRANNRFHGSQANDLKGFSENTLLSKENLPGNERGVELLSYEDQIENTISSGLNSIKDESLTSLQQDASSVAMKTPPQAAPSGSASMASLMVQKGVLAHG